MLWSGNKRESLPEEHIRPRHADIDRKQHLEAGGEYHLPAVPRQDRGGGGGGRSEEEIFVSCYGNTVKIILRQSQHKVSTFKSSYVPFVINRVPKGFLFKFSSKIHNKIMETSSMLH